VAQASVPPPYPAEVLDWHCQVKGWAEKGLGTAFKEQSSDTLATRFLSPCFEGFGTARHDRKRFAPRRLEPLHGPLSTLDCRQQSTPKIAQLALNAVEDLIKVPLVTWPGPMATKVVCEGATKFQAPSANARIGDNDAAVGQ
jgi:hypothetical protein